MREIKFRAWDGNKIYHWNDINHPLTNEIKNTPYPKLFYLPMSCLVGDMNDFKWMQYTGLKDENETEIYEGDILRDNKNQYGKVFWHNACFRIEWEIRDNLGQKKVTEIDNCFVGTIVGNIYENKNLLIN